MAAMVTFVVAMVTVMAAMVIIMAAIATWATLPAPMFCCIASYDAR